MILRVALEGLKKIVEIFASVALLLSILQEPTPILTFISQVFLTAMLLDNAKQSVSKPIFSPTTKLASGCIESQLKSLSSPYQSYSPSLFSKQKQPKSVSLFWQSLYAHAT